MRGEEKANFLNVIDKKIISSIKAGAWVEIAEHIAELKDGLAAADASKADKNWTAPAVLQSQSAVDSGRKLAWAVADGYQGAGFCADIPMSTGLLGDNKARNIELVKTSESGLCFFEFNVTGTGEDICKGLRQLIVHSVLYRTFLENPRHFGYNTEKSPLLLNEPDLSWELIGPKDMINPRRAEMRWVDRDTHEMQKLMKILGVSSFSLGRLQAEAETLQINIEKDNFSGNRAKQWFENRTTVLIA